MVVIHEMNAGARAWIETDLGALAHNAREIAKFLPLGCEMMAVVKADAYGHGMIRCAERLRQEGVKTFAVATAAEGIELRERIGDCDILILGFTHPRDARYLNTHRLAQLVVDGGYADALGEAGYDLKIHIAIDTGMHRLGILHTNLTEIESVYKHKNLTVEGVGTHLSSPDSFDESDISFTNLQMDRFYAVVEKLKNKGYDTGKLHAQSSYAIFNYPEIRCDYARPGIILFGVLSQKEEMKIMPSLRPVLSLKANIAQVKWIEAGETVSYGRLHKTEAPARIATVGIGYADGIPRQITGNGAMCIVNGHKVPIIGRICMDLLMLDVTAAGDVNAGDIATFIGRDGDEVILCEELAAAAGTITNDILSRLGVRLPKVYTG